MIPAVADGKEGIYDEVKANDWSLTELGRHKEDEEKGDNKKFKKKKE